MKYQVGIEPGISVEWDQVDIVGNGRWIHCYNYDEMGFPSGESFYYPESRVRYFKLGDENG